MLRGIKEHIFLLIDLYDTTNIFESSIENKTGYKKVVFLADTPPPAISISTSLSFLLSISIIYTPASLNLPENGSSHGFEITS